MITFHSIISHAVPTSPASTSHTFLFQASDVRPSYTAHTTRNNTGATSTFTYSTEIYGVDAGVTTATTISVGSGYTSSTTFGSTGSSLTGRWSSSIFFSASSETVTQDGGPSFSNEGSGSNSQSGSTSAPAITASSTYTTGFTTSVNTTKFYRSGKTSLSSVTAHTSTSTTKAGGATTVTTRTTSVAATTAVTAFTSTGLTTMASSSSTTGIVVSHVAEIGTVLVCQPSETGYIMDEGFGDVASLGASFTRTTLEMSSTSWLTWTTGGPGLASDASYSFSAETTYPTSSQEISSSSLTYTSRAATWPEYSLPHETETSTVSLPQTTHKSFGYSEENLGEVSGKTSCETTAASTEWLSGRDSITPDNINGLDTSATSYTNLVLTTSTGTNNVPTTFSNTETFLVVGGVGSSTQYSQAGSFVTAATRVSRHFTVRSTSSTFISTAKSTQLSVGYFLPSQVVEHPISETAAALSANVSVNWYNFAFWSDASNARTPVSYPKTLSATTAAAGITTSVTASIDQDTLRGTLAYKTTVVGGTTVTKFTTSAQLIPLGSVPPALMTGQDTVAASHDLIYGVPPGVYRTATGTSMSPTINYESASTSTAALGSRIVFEPVPAFDVKTSIIFGPDASAYTDKSAVVVHSASPYIPSSIQ